MEAEESALHSLYIATRCVALTQSCGQAKQAFSFTLIDARAALVIFSITVLVIFCDLSLILSNDTLTYKKSDLKYLKPVLLFPLIRIAHTITRISAEIHYPTRQNKVDSAQSNNLAIVKTFAEIRIEKRFNFIPVAHRKNLYTFISDCSLAQQ